MNVLIDDLMEHAQNILDNEFKAFIKAPSIATKIDMMDAMDFYLNTLKYSKEAKYDESTDQS